MRAISFLCLLIIIVCFVGCKQSSSQKDMAEDEITVPTENLMGTSRCDLQPSIIILGDSTRFTKDLIYRFLYAFDSSCTRNVEFSEISNEALFIALHQNPNMVIQVLSKNDDLKLDFILIQIANPISDRFDLGKLKQAILSADNCQNVRRQVSKALQEAREKV